MSDRLKVIANPSVLQIGFSVCGTLFFSCLIFLCYDKQWIANEKSETVMIWLILVLFGAFAFASLYI